MPLYPNVNQRGLIYLTKCISSERTSAIRLELIECLKEIINKATNTFECANFHLLEKGSVSYLLR